MINLLRSWKFGFSKYHFKTSSTFTVNLPSQYILKLYSNYFIRKIIKNRYFFDIKLFKMIEAINQYVKTKFVSISLYLMMFIKRRYDVFDRLLRTDIFDMLYWVKRILLKAYYDTYVYTKIIEHQYLYKIPIRKRTLELGVTYIRTTISYNIIFNFKGFLTFKIQYVTLY